MLALRRQTLVGRESLRITPSRSQGFVLGVETRCRLFAKIASLTKI